MGRGLRPERILAVWDEGRAASPPQRALSIWAAAEPERSREELAAEPVGRRDAALIGTRVDTFGPAADCIVHCPECTEPLEFELDLRDLLLPPPAAGSGPWTVEAAGWAVTIRLPDSDDLEAAAGAADPAAVLIDRCILTATLDGEAQPAAAAHAAVGEAIEAEMERLDPQADINFTLTCAECSHAWETRFDIAAFLWRELDAEASRLTAEVALLAGSFGWTEAEVLQLGPARRRRYLDLAGAS